MLGWKFRSKLRKILLPLSEKLLSAPTPNDKGNRDIEYSYIASSMPSTEESLDDHALDFGSGNSYMGLLAARAGFHTVAIDVVKIQWPYTHPMLSYIYDDFLSWGTTHQTESYDLIINCSTIEHVGVGRYPDKDKIDGDLYAMQLLRSLMKSDAMMLMTTQIGKDVVIPGVHRIYGAVRLPKLLARFEILHEEYWIKDSKNRWFECSKDEALETEGSDHYYALGLFVLGKSK